MLERIKNNSLVQSVHPFSKTFFMWVLCSTLTGVLCGIVGAIFYHMVTWATAMRLANPWLLYFLPVGGLAIVFVYSAAGMSTERGTNAVIDSAHQGKRAPLRLTPLIMFATVITHLFGGSAGREGAALQIGGSMGGWLGEKLRLKQPNQSFMVMAGMSAVFSALFGTPLTAAIFSIEVICVGVIYHAALLPCALASLSAYGTAVALGAKPERFVIHQAAQLSMDNAWRVLVLGIGCAVLGIVFCTVMHLASQLYKTKLPNQYARILVGAGLIILLTLLYGSRTFNGAGMNVVEQAITEGHVENPLSFAMKILLTAVTLGCGFRGGEIVPTFFAGATFGCLVGPWLGLDPGLAAAVALVATFCAVTNCPFASIALGIELFGTQPLLMYLLACAVSYLLSGYCSLYSSQKILFSKLTHEPLGKKTKALAANEAPIHSESNETVDLQPAKPSAAAAR